MNIMDILMLLCFVAIAIGGGVKVTIGDVNIGKNIDNNVRNKDSQ